MIMMTKKSNHGKKGVYNIGCEGHKSRNPGSLPKYYFKFFELCTSLLTWKETRARRCWRHRFQWYRSSSRRSSWKSVWKASALQIGAPTGTRRGGCSGRRPVPPEGTQETTKTPSFSPFIKNKKLQQKKKDQHQRWRNKHISFNPREMGLDCLIEKIEKTMGEEWEWEAWVVDRVVKEGGEVSMVGGGRGCNACMHGQDTSCM